MKRLPSTLLLGVALPCGLAVLLALLAAHSAQGDLQAVSLARRARLDTALEAAEAPRTPDNKAAPPASTAGVTVLAAAPVFRQPVVPSKPLTAVSALLLLAAAAGWAVPRARSRTATQAAAALAALLPIAAASLFLSSLGATVHKAGRDATVGDLTRAVVAARALGAEDVPDSVRAVTGFAATRVRDHEVEATTLTGATASLADVPAPPPSFTTSGMVALDGGPAVYVAGNLKSGGFLVVSAPFPRDIVNTFRRRTLLIAAGLALWILGTGVVAWRRRTLSA